MNKSRVLGRRREYILYGGAKYLQILGMNLAAYHLREHKFLTLLLDFWKICAHFHYIRTYENRENVVLKCNSLFVKVTFLVTSFRNIDANMSVTN